MTELSAEEKAALQGAIAALIMQIEDTAASLVSLADDVPEKYRTDAVIQAAKNVAKEQYWLDRVRHERVIQAAKDVAKVLSDKKLSLNQCTVTLASVLVMVNALRKIEE